MPTAPFKRLTRRMIWSASASITLLFLTSTSSLPSVAVPPAGFSLGLDELFAGPAGLDLAALRLPPHAQAAASAQFHLESGRRSPASDHRPLPRTAALQSRDPRRRERYGRRFAPARLDRRGRIELPSGRGLDQGRSRPDAAHAAAFRRHRPVDSNAVDPLDPTVNLNLGARYLRDLRKRYDGDLELALAAYHAGPGTIDRFGGLPPYRETQAYVSRVLKLYSDTPAGSRHPGARRGLVRFHRQ